MTDGSALPLALDDMYSPVVAEASRESDYDVVAVAERADLRAMADAEILAWAVSQRRWLVTENVKDFRPLLLQAMQSDAAQTGILIH